MLGVGAVSLGDSPAIRQLTLVVETGPAGEEAFGAQRLTEGKLYLV